MNKRNITMGGAPLTLAGKEVKIGEHAPDFTVVDVGLKEVNFAQFKGKKILISVFPSIDTGVCASQTRKFNEEASKLPNVQIINISVDLPFALDRFCAAEGIKNTVTLSDHRNLDFGMKYGFVIDELRLLSRGIVVVDEKGIITYVEYVSEVTNHPDYEKALNAVK